MNEQQQPPEQSSSDQPPVVDYAPDVVETDPQARQLGMFCHLAGLAGYVLPAFGNIIGPLIIWLMKKDEFAFADSQGKESLNFQISITIYATVATLLMFVCIGFLLLPAVGVFDLVMIIIASIKANKGEPVTYPLCIRFIK